jgi:hypothetical protein
MILFESFKHIDSICKEYGIKNYTINNNGLVDVDGDVDLSSKSLDKLPVNFGTVTGHFSCYNNLLVSLEGSPIKVGGYFDCSDNHLTSLEGSPREVGGSFNCHYNQLTSLEGSPREVGGNFYCSDNQLRTLKGISERIDGDLFLTENPINNICRLFKTTKQFIELLNDYNFIYKDKIIKARFEQACIDAGIEIPKTIKDYDII